MENIKKLGFGLMRLPQKNDTIDIEETARCADLFLSRGFKYFDTAYVYDGSEEAFRDAIGSRHPRESYYLANKMPMWLVHDVADLDRIFNESLTRCAVNYFDYYLLHSLKGNEKEHSVLAKYDAWGWLARKKEEGLVRHIGFSYHGKADELDKILTEHPEIEFVQLQINYVDWDNNTIQSRLNWETARRHGKDIIIMEPVKGGSLVTMPDNIRNIFLESNNESSVASWAVRFAASLDGVIVVLSGMSNYEQTDDNTSYMQNFIPISESEHGVIKHAREEIAKIPIIPCTSCRYCVPECPMKIDIPEVITTLNTYKVYGNLPAQKRHYTQGVIKGKGKASQCIICNNCQAHCPQNLSISEHMTEAAKIFE